MFFERGGAMAYIKGKDLPSGRRIYVVRFKDQHGIWRERSAGPRRKDAEALLRRIQEEVASGTFERERKDPRFAEYYASWFEAKSKALKPSSLADYRNAFARYILPRFGKMRLSQITPLIVQKWVNDLSSSGLSAASVRKAYRYFASCLNQARKQGILEADPFRGVILPRMPARELDFLDPEEIRRLLDVCEPRERALFAVLAYGGLRLGEVLALRVQDVDLEAGALRVERSLSTQGTIGEPKSASGRRAVPMPGILLEELASYVPPGAKPDDLLFPSRVGTPINHANVMKRFLRALEEAGLRRVTIHSLRHSYASQALAAGASIKALQRALGHSSATMTLNTYAHLVEEDMSAAMIRLDQAFRGREAPVLDLGKSRRGRER